MVVLQFDKTPCLGVRQTGSRPLVELATGAFRNLWNRQILKAGVAKKSIGEEIRSIERKVAQLLDRIVEAESKAVVQAYQTRIAELERRKLFVREQLVGCDKPIKEFEELFRTALKFIANLWNI